jgi:hypothetical protein
VRKGSAPARRPTPTAVTFLNWGSIEFGMGQGGVRVDAVGVMDPMLPFHPRCGKLAAGDIVDADGQDFVHDVKSTPRTYHGLVMPGAASPALASIAECRTMPAFSNVRLSVLWAPSRVRYAGFARS